LQFTLCCGGNIIINIIIIIIIIITIITIRSIFKQVVFCSAARIPSAPFPHQA